MCCLVGGSCNMLLLRHIDRINSNTRLHATERLHFLLELDDEPATLVSADSKACLESFNADEVAEPAELGPY